MEGSDTDERIAKKLLHFFRMMAQVVDVGAKLREAMDDQASANAAAHGGCFVMSEVDAGVAQQESENLLQFAIALR